MTCWSHSTTWLAVIATPVTTECSSLDLHPRRVENFRFRAFVDREWAASLAGSSMRREQMNKPGLDEVTITNPPVDKGF